MSDINEFGQKKAYSFDKQTNVFIGVVWADVDQLDSDEYLLPANATFQVPVETSSNQVAVWNGKQWSAVSDICGTEYWLADGSHHTISELGEELPEDALLEEPIIPTTSEEQTALTNAECSKRINAHWNQIGQINASLGVYGELDTANCAAWISSNRSALISLLAREDFLEIDVTDDQHWPVFEGSN